MNSRIPLPNPNHVGEVFKDVFDYWETIKKRQAQQPLIEAQAKHAAAQAEREKTLSKLPFGGHQLPGAAGQSLALKMIKDEFGENSQEYKDAKYRTELQNRRDEETISYQQALQNSLEKRHASPEGKRAQEEEEIDRGLIPGTTVGGKKGRPLTPDQQNKLKGQYALKDIKNVTDVGVRQRIINAKNMETTLKGINPKDLTSYSGLQGGIELVADTAADAKGNTSPRYKKYQAALTAAEALAKQVRQFYGDSITPQIQKGITQLTNPSFWLKSPEVAEANFIYYRDKILRPEARNLISAAHTANIYEQEPENEYTDDELEKFAKEAREAGVSEESITKKMAELKGNK